MNKIDYWRLCDEFTILQAALLVVGEDPSLAEWIENWDLDRRPEGYEAVKAAICGGLKNYIVYQEKCASSEGQLHHLATEYGHVPDLSHEQSQYLSSLFNRSVAGTLVPRFDSDEGGKDLRAIEGTIDLYRSTVNAESLKKWLRLKGFTSDFFFPEPTQTMDYLDPSNPRYAPKLAAAVCAWQSVTKSGKKSPKQALDKWLRDHAADFGLINNDGKPIEQAIEECSKVANWNTKGGATKTMT